MTMGVKVKFSGILEEEGELNYNTPSICRLSKQCIRNMLATAWCLSLKPVGLLAGDV